MQRQGKAPDKISWGQTLRLLTSEKALSQRLTGQEPVSVFTLFRHLLGQLAELQKRLVTVMILFVFIVILLLYLLGQVSYHDTLYNMTFIALVWGGVSTVVLWLIHGGIWHQRNLQVNRLLRHLWEGQMIARASWPQALPTLLALMEQTGWPRDDELRLWWWGETYPILVRWLPRLQPGELGTNECRTLRKLLRLNHQYEDLQVAILLALGTARDAKARRVATKLLQSSPHERVREAARECLRELGA